MDRPCPPQLRLQLHHPRTPSVLLSPCSNERNTSESAGVDSLSFSFDSQSYENKRLWLVADAALFFGEKKKPKRSRRLQVTRAWVVSCRIVHSLTQFQPHRQLGTLGSARRSSTSLGTIGRVPLGSFFFLCCSCSNCFFLCHRD